MKDTQKKMLAMMNKVARNSVSDAINNILDAVSKHLENLPEEQTQMYNMILDILKDQNQQLWFNISLRLGKIYLDQAKMQDLDDLLNILKRNCMKQSTDGDGDQIMSGGERPKINTNSPYDPDKSNLLLETFALEIQMCDKVGDKKRMKRVYPQTMNLDAVISDPRVMGTIKECGGKLYMSEKKWELALETLFDCFKCYQESGNVKAKNILVYVILASMLCSATINYAETREAKVYKDDK